MTSGLARRPGRRLGPGKTLEDGGRERSPSSASSPLRRIRLRAVGLALIVLLAGCHVYVPVDREGLGVRDGVRVRLDEDRDARGNFRALAGSEGSIDGEVVDWDDRSLVLSVWRSDLRNQVRYEAARQEITLPWTGVQAVEKSELSWTRTGALGVIVGLGVAALITNVMEDTGGSGGTGNGNGGTPN